MEGKVVLPKTLAGFGCGLENDRRYVTLAQLTPLLQKGMSVLKAHSAIASRGHEHAL